MAQYKVVKHPRYATIYYVYKKYLGLWWSKGYATCYYTDEEKIVKAAKELVAPNTIYFDA